MNLNTDFRDTLQEYFLNKYSILITTSKDEKLNYLRQYYCLFQLQYQTSIDRFRIGTTTMICQRR